MLCSRPDGSSSIRAIFTMHDQSQIDYVNDQHLVHHAPSNRAVVLTQIFLKAGQTPGGPWARIEFVTSDGQRVYLEVHAAGQPEAKRGGLTDPGSHGSKAGLPLMWRGRSALASPFSRVAIDGIEYVIPVKINAAPHYVGLNGYYTELHRMGILRAGQTLVGEAKSPPKIEAGRHWSIAQGGAERHYKIEKIHSDDCVTAVCRGSTVETVIGRLNGDCFDLHRVHVVATQAAEGFSIEFNDGRFVCVLDEVGPVATGIVEMSGCSHDGCIKLTPESPIWARSRELTVGCRLEKRQWTIATRVGDAEC